MEVNPFSPQRDLIDFCQGGQIVVVTNEPLAKGLRNNNSTLKAIANELETSVQKVLPTLIFTRSPFFSKILKASFGARFRTVVIIVVTVVAFVKW